MLAKIMSEPRAPAAARVTAANSLLDRGWGKAAQDLTVTHVQQIEQLTDEEVARRLDQLRRVIGDAAGAANIAALAEAPLDTTKPN